MNKSKFILSKEFIERGKVSIEKEFDGDKAIDIYAKIKFNNEKSQKRNKKMLYKSWLLKK